MNRLQMAVQLVLISLVLSLTACEGADKALAERAGYLHRNRDPAEKRFLTAGKKPARNVADSQDMRGIGYNRENPQRPIDLKIQTST